MNLIHNHQLVNENHRMFMSNERHIPDDIKQRIELLCRAGIDVPTIRAILKEEFGDLVTWVYDDIYNFIYQLEGSFEKRELDAEEFIKILEQFKYNNDEFLYYIDINETTKKIERNLSMKLGTNWSAFIRDLYKCFGEMDILNFLTQWDTLKTLYSPVATYLLHIEKTKEKWAACYNCDTFMADMTTTQHGESINNMMKGYLDANTSLTAFISAFQSALDIFQIQRYEKETNGRIVEYNSESNYFICSCKYTQFSGFICRHIFRKKNPNEKELINNYITFITLDSPQQLALSSNELNNYQDDQYMFTRLLQKIQRFVIQNPTMATTLYTTFNKIFDSEIEKINRSQSNSSKITATIKNLLITQGRVHSQGSSSLDQYFVETDFLPDESNLGSSSSSKYFIEPGFLSDESSLEKSQDDDKHCQYFGETLPNPLPLKVLEYLSDIAAKKKFVRTADEQYEFCWVHREEGIIIPYGIEKGYPLFINFAELPNQITNLKNELLKIIKGVRYSEYHVNAIKRIQEIGISKANSPLLQINHFESYQFNRIRFWRVDHNYLTNLTLFFFSPGIMGPKGLAAILTTLTDTLIAEDFNNISLKAAKEIMIDSIEFGQYVYDDSN
ncbi:15183_t:CDS:10 [Gigaspora margarita]|uniref:15183_t:CDS:1 n=1 Tax=Gigaspora margarita TaxID=4874 RepID=A0ABN7V4W3_GIGMA|nr:15183_t:CDS:10 [Gigaspora margarita]